MKTELTLREKDVDPSKTRKQYCIEILPKQ